MKAFYQTAAAEIIYLDRKDLIVTSREATESDDGDVDLPRVPLP